MVAPQSYSFESLKEVLEAQGGSYDLDAVKRAYDAAEKAHAKQRRLSGEPYLSHPVCVAKIVAELGMDGESIIASLLHDTVEDTEMTIEDVKRDFGENVALLVDGVTKLGQVNTSSREQAQAENIRKMLLAMNRDIRVIIIKLADRLHNMRTIDAQAGQKQRDKSLETLEVYAPIAHRLGIRAVKEELEDLAIAHLDPIAYAEIEHRLEENREYRNNFIDNIKKILYERLKDYPAPVEIEGRVKSVHGIYRKMFMQGKQFEEIYDIYAVRIIIDTENENECYNILGIIHDMFNPIPGRFKDYISTPKPNGYKSLHTTVIKEQGAPFEVQIRTRAMHRTAEYGIAAHWKYKAGINGSEERFEERLAWIRQLLESQNDADDAEEIVRTIKTDLAPEDVFALTPNGDIKSLPVGSTVIDFAYAIHSAVGNRMVGAKVDGRIVPIDYKIKTGEVIEIITTNQAGHGPSRDWLKLVKTSEARSKIRAWFKKERRAENIEQGREELEKEFRRNGINLPDDEMQKFLSELAVRQKCPDVEELYARIGYGGLVLSRIMPRIRDEYAKIARQDTAPDIADIPQHKASPEGIIVEGIDNCLVKLSRCCTPIPGDSIIGFITRGHGVSIHKRDCANVPKEIALAAEPNRWIKAYWSEKHNSSFSATIQLLGFDREGLLADITAAIANMRIMIQGINARPMRDGNYCIDITMRIESIEHLRSIIQKISKINGVYSVERMQG